MADAQVNFGDGSAQADATFGTPINHVYGAGRYGVTARNASDGRRGNARVVGPGTFEITVTDPLAVDPVITSLTPATAVAGSGVASVAVAGTGFDQSSTVESDGAAMPTVRVSATALTAAFDPGADAKTVQFTVRNSSKKESNDSPFVITAVDDEGES